MNYQFSIPSLPETPQCSPNQLIQLASNLPDVTISIPSVDKVLEAIEQGKADQISKLDWIYCIHAKAQWDQQNIDRSGKTSAAIWNVAISNLWLQHQLVWRLALYYGDRQEQALAQSIAKSFDIFASSGLVSHLLPVQIIRALRSTQAGIELAKIACEKRVNRTGLLNIIKEDLPIWIPLFSTFIEEITPYFTTICSPSQQQVRWLLSCLDEMSESQQIKAVDHLLTNVSNDIASNHSVLIDWLKHNYRNGENWYKLSDSARQRLREWIGGINYADFQKLVDIILNKLDLQKFESDRLRSRRKFWASYSNRFERLRILLPKTSQIAIGYQIQGDIDLLQDDGSDSTEVCIFDFGEWFVVEFFRGRGSEMLLLPNNSRNQQILFGESTLSVKRIRCLGGDRHDHVFLWQFFCRQWLANKGINPNPGIKPYTNPTADELRDRENQLERWQREIERLEREARAYV
ncbi:MULTISPECIES: EH signature domain-containing protein [unclassified Nostoc]|uniref:EH signature domain-containing protein n=1 Tax=unclassified Nostoc TaxID=2593658 RepID=UPI002AD36E93|nr:EH signature domain-containing protein [Nostoc sp. DedQUE03]MDZ7972980.1 EH signature domain-containing protein [Nostoc sp. DedQUE03]MDZ8044161.1 EH signature domain-containing protein [Nostoc sp. DedQUE02]